jgi:hypothetical protein
MEEHDIMKKVFFVLLLFCFGAIIYSQTFITEIKVLSYRINNTIEDSLKINRAEWIADKNSNTLNLYGHDGSIVNTIKIFDRNERGHFEGVTVLHSFNKGGTYDFATIYDEIGEYGIAHILKQYNLAGINPNQKCYRFSIDGPNLRIHSSGGAMWVEPDGKIDIVILFDETKWFRILE